MQNAHLWKVTSNSFQLPWNIGNIPIIDVGINSQKGWQKIMMLNLKPTQPNWMSLC
jgi:hypothetical protein